MPGVCLVLPGIAVISVLLGACADSSGTREPTLPQQKRSQWILPLDHYVAQTNDLSGVASRLAMQPCLRARGRDWAATAIEATAKPGESWNSARRKLFSVELAKKYGYGNSDELDLPEAEIQTIVEVDDRNRKLGVEAAPDVEACTAKADRELGMSPKSPPWELANSLSVTAYETALQSKSVGEAARRWVACMRPVGVAGLPNSPESMPADSVLSSGPNVDAPRIGAGQLDPEERRIAVADAECRESSGYSEAAYLAEWKAQVKELGDNADALERLDKQMQKINRRAEKVIADYVPSAK